jgi:protein-L-isoaspartate(D-aspartate) O-methyltransferase
MTATADPQEVHQDVSVAIDAERALYNGPPGLVATWIDSLEVQAGDHVLHIGCGTGYYTAILAHLTGPTGRVTAVDADARLAARAGAALADRPWAAAAAGDGRTGLPRNVDVLVVHAGATHVLDEWLDAMRPGGRLIVPLTSSLPGMPPTLGKGVVLTARWEAAGWRATIGSMVMIYSLVALRDEAANAALGRALQTGAWAEVTRLRRDAHEPSAACWLHGGATCLSRA